MVLKINQLGFAYDDHIVLKDINFSLPHPGLCHLQGLNGVGKSTLLKCLVGILKPCHGEIVWGRGQTAAYLGHQLALHPQLSLRENIELGLELVDMEQLNHYLHHTNLHTLQDEPIKHLSMGQKTKAALIRVFLSAATVWVLDEPFANLDVMAAKWLNRATLTHLSKQGSVILTAHQASFDLEEGKIWHI